MILRAIALATLAATSLQVPNLDGKLVDPLAAPAGTKATVLLFVSTDCPISNRYAPDVRKLHEMYKKDGVVFWLVYSNPADGVADIRDHLKSFSFPDAALRDAKQDLARRAGATITPEAVVYDGKGNLTYRGRIDDRYAAVGVSRATAMRHDLQDAVAATIAGKPIKDRFTQAVGCYIADFSR